MNEKDFLNTLKEYLDVEGRNEILHLLDNCKLNFNYTSVFATKSYQFRAYVYIRVPVSVISKLKEFQSELNKYCGDIFLENEQYAFYGVEIKPLITSSDENDLECEERNITNKQKKNSIKVSSKTAEALAQTIVGDNNKSFYRKGFQIVKFFNELGFNDIYGSDFPSRINYAREKIESINEIGNIKSVFENLLDPREYIDSEYTVEAVAQYLNLYLKYDGLILIKSSGFYRLSVKKEESIEEVGKLTAITEEIVETVNTQARNGVKLFFSYCHKDEAMRDELEKHLVMLKRQGIISTWYDRKIDAGNVLDTEIDMNLKTADIILLLVSVDFLASDYCYNREMEEALKMHESKKAVVVPIILRSCDWTSAPFAKLLALPTDAKSVSIWADKDEAFLNIVKGIKNIAAKI